MAQLNLRPLIDHAIGSLGDFSGDIGGWRTDLSKIRLKRKWTNTELFMLQKSLEMLAKVCGRSLKDWEEETGVKIPRK